MLCLTKGCNEHLRLAGKCGGEETGSRWGQRAVTRREPWRKPVLGRRTPQSTPKMDYLPCSVLCATDPAWKVLGGTPWLSEMRPPSVCQGRERKPWSVAESPLALLRN